MGVGAALGELLIHWKLPLSLACFVLSAAIRIIQGSATVACLTTVGLLMLVMQQLNLNGVQLAALSVCIGNGLSAWL